MLEKEGGEMQAFVGRPKVAGEASRHWALSSAAALRERRRHEDTGSIFMASAKAAV